MGSEMCIRDSARTRYGAILSSPDESWLYRCLQAVIRKVLSSLHARRPRCVLTARRASSEDKTLWSKACRHQDSQESSGDDKMAPYRVQARAPPHRTSTVHASGPLGDLHATNAPHTPLFNLAHFSRALAREQCARATAEAAPSRPKAALPAPSLNQALRGAWPDRPISG